MSNATTMNSTPIIFSNNTTTYHSGSHGGRHYVGSSTTYGSPTIIPARTPTPVVTGGRETSILVPLVGNNKAIGMA